MKRKIYIARLKAYKYVVNLSRCTPLLPNPSTSDCRVMMIGTRKEETNEKA